jgi:glycosyltransferase involved in cell wall biosynthesis
VIRYSIVVPAFNEAGRLPPYLEDVVEFFDGRGEAYEVVVVDDGSTDNVGEILNGYGASLRIFHQENRGPAAALNVGLAAATGDTIAFLDADDLWTGDKLSRECEALAEDPSLDGVFGYVEQFISPDVATDIAGRYAIPDKPQPGVSRDALLIRNSAFDRFGAFDASLRAGEFVAWYSRAVLMGLKTRIISTVVARRRIHTANTGIVRRSQQQQETLLGLQRALEVRRKEGR